MSHTDSLNSQRPRRHTTNGHRSEHGGAVGAVEGVRELELGTELVADLDVIAPEGREQPHLPRTHPKGGVRRLARGEGSGGCRVVCVHDDCGS